VEANSTAKDTGVDVVVADAVAEEEEGSGD